MNHRFTVFLVDRFRERNAHRTSPDTILSVAAIRDSVVLHDRIESIIARCFSGWVHIEESNLRDRLGTYIVISLILRASLETTTASHTT